MFRIDDRTVELTPAEQLVRDAFNYLLDLGHGIPQATQEVLLKNRYGPQMTPEFAEYLSDGTVTMTLGVDGYSWEPIFTSKGVEILSDPAE